ncbi:hypothetical protein SISSUDRAFT_1131803 [Sistotremastrum suecicum HHB10207 ss-3]|uniref:F-box domain-containing protein n=1 Tax=Sistotremastrum suecicum HHB10207 ss-3 TaxID=1314776 RepID=A0A165ZPS1_9AGAM|nr:hypothetical protein SISSUDRAFT_1131803 [Sistotremastrum suecicum HHB10207 ss-3]
MPGLHDLPSELILHISRNIGIDGIVSLALTCGRFRALIISSRILAGAYDSDRITSSSEKLEPTELYKKALRSYYLSLELSTCDKLHSSWYQDIQLDASVKYREICHTDNGVVVLNCGKVFHFCSTHDVELWAEFNADVGFDDEDEDGSWIHGVKAYGAIGSEVFYVAYLVHILKAPSYYALHIEEFSAKPVDFDTRLRNIRSGSFHSDHVGCRMELHMRCPYVVVLPDLPHSYPSFVYDWSSGKSKKFSFVFQRDMERAIIRWAFFHPLRDSLVVRYESWSFPGDTTDVGEMNIPSQITFEDSSTDEFEGVLDTVYLKSLFHINNEDQWSNCEQDVADSAPYLTGESTWAFTLFVLPHYWRGHGDEDEDDLPGDGSDKFAPRLVTLHFSDSEPSPKMVTTMIPYRTDRSYRTLRFLGPELYCGMGPAQPEYRFRTFVLVPPAVGTLDPRLVELEHDWEAMLDEPSEYSVASEYLKGARFDTRTGKLTAAYPDCLLCIQY